MRAESPPRSQTSSLPGVVLCAPSGHQFTRFCGAHWYVVIFHVPVLKLKDLEAKSLRKSIKDRRFFIRESIRFAGLMEQVFREGDLGG